MNPVQANEAPLLLCVFQNVLALRRVCELRQPRLCRESHLPNEWIPGVHEGAFTRVLYWARWKNICIVFVPIATVGSFGSRFFTHLYRTWPILICPVAD